MGYHTRIKKRLAQVRVAVPILPIGIGVLIGQAVAWWLSEEEIWWGIGALGAALALSRGWSVILGRGVVLGVLLGLSTALMQIVNHPAIWGGGDVQVPVRVEDPPVRRKTGEVTFIGREVLGELGRTIRCRAVDLPWRNATGLERGDIVWVRGAITPVSRSRNPLSWEGAQWRRGISGELRALFVSRPLVRSTSPVDTLRDSIRSTVERATDESRGGALFLSMALGERDVLSVHVEEAFKAVGMSHLLVVSGYQVSLVFGVVFAVCTFFQRAVGVGLRLRTLAIWCALGFSVLYVALVGAEMSSVRALVAATCLCVALVVDRPHRFAQRWATALLVMHVLYPWALFDVGVILTFAALGGIGVGGVLGNRNGVVAYLWITVSVWLLTSSVTLIWNGSFSLVGMVLNLLLAAPWSVWNCAAGGLALGVASLSIPLGDYPLRVIAWGNEVVVQLVLLVATNFTSRDPLEGAVRWGVALMLVAVSALLIAKAGGRRRGVALRALTERP